VATYFLSLRKSCDEVLFNLLDTRKAVKRLDITETAAAWGGP